MSASMDLAPVRVKLFFDNASVESSWALINSKKLPHIRDVINYIKRKFLMVEDGSLHLSISGCSIPTWEKTSIIRNEDCVHVRYTDREEENSPMYVPNADQSLKSHHKKKKKAKKQDRDEENEHENNEIEDSQSKSFDSTLLPQKKKRKHSENDISKQEESVTKHAEINQQESVCVEKDANAEQMDITPVPKRKRHRVRKRRNKREDVGTPVQPSVTEPPVQSEVFVKPLNIQLPRWRRENSYTKKTHVKFDSDGEDEASVTETEQDEQMNLSAEGNGVSVGFGYSYPSSSEEFVQKIQDVGFNVENTNNRNNISESQDHSQNAVQESTQNAIDNFMRPATSQTVLPNGVKVYSRPRSRQNKSHNYRELTKEDQLNTVLTNKSYIVQNNSSISSISTPIGEVGNPSETSMQEEKTNLVAIPLWRDYSKFPLLQGHPKPGGKIAYKVLEMSENYTPEIGDYKEAVVLNFDVKSQMVELKNLTNTINDKRNGKFEVEFSDDEISMNNEQEVQSFLLTQLMEVREVTD